MFKAKKSVASITAGFQKMVTDLQTHMQESKAQKEALEAQVAYLDDELEDAEFVLDKLQGMLPSKE